MQPSEQLSDALDERLMLLDPGYRDDHTKVKQRVDKLRVELEGLLRKKKLSPEDYEAIARA